MMPDNVFENYSTTIHVKDSGAKSNLVKGFYLEYGENGKTLDNSKLTGKGFERWEFNQYMHN